MQKQKGFTIIELIVVIAIIAVLAGIVLVNVQQYVARSKESALKANMRDIQIAAASYVESNPGSTDPYTDFWASSSAVATCNAIKGLWNTGGCGVFTVSTDKTKFCHVMAMGTTVPQHYWCVDSSGNALDSSPNSPPNCTNASITTCN